MGRNWIQLAPRHHAGLLAHVVRELRLGGLEHAVHVHPRRREPGTWGIIMSKIILVRAHLYE
jgi:hypothetical protein